MFYFFFLQLLFFSSFVAALPKACFVRFFDATFFFINYCIALLFRQVSGFRPLKCNFKMQSYFTKSLFTLRPLRMSFFWRRLFPKPFLVDNGRFILEIFLQQFLRYKN